MEQDINNVVFRKAQEALNKLMEKYFTAYDDAMIYHYTSPLGLEGILKGEELWFTKSDYLNDSTEMNYIFQTLDKALDESRYSKDFCNHIRDRFIKSKVGFQTYNADDYYICSFSKSNDELNMWNYYSKSESKAGYNISFKSLELLKCFKKTDDIHFNMGDVVYGDEVQTKIWNPTLELFNKLYLDACHKENSMDLVSIDNVLVDIFLIYAPFIKHTAFKSEAERRIIYRVSKHDDKKNEINIREQNGIFIPYIRLEFEKEAIQSIMISPYVKSDNKVKSLEMLLKQYGYNAKINLSDIPIRY